MDYSYVAYGKDKKMVKGKLSATNQTAAAKLLSYGGYRVLSIKPITSFINMERLSAAFSQVKPKEVTMFSRQLALLLESGTDIVASLELLQGQVANRAFRRVIGHSRRQPAIGGADETPPGFPRDVRPDNSRR